MITQVRSLEGEALERVFNRVLVVFASLLETCGPAARPYGLFETLLHAYSDMDSDTFLARIGSLVDDHGSALRHVIDDHSPGSANYVQGRDWLYREPEVLLVADLARSFPRRLRAIAAVSDLSALEPMIDELNGK